MSYTAAIVLGVFLALLLIVISRKLQQEQIVLGGALVVAAFWYIGFGIFNGQSLSELMPQIVAGIFFIGLAVLGVARSVLYLSAGWGLHVIWDYVGPSFGEVLAPWWTAPTCLGFDVVIAFYIIARYWGYAPVPGAISLNA